MSHFADFAANKKAEELFPLLTLRLGTISSFSSHENDPPSSRRAGKPVIKRGRVVGHAVVVGTDLCTHRVESIRLLQAHVKSLADTERREDLVEQISRRGFSANLA